MKVNELKALFEKNGVFQNLMPPSMKPSFHPAPRSEPLTPPKPKSIIQSQANPPPPIQIQPSVRKNNDFLNELNKKLMNKSAREKVIEGMNQQQEPIFTIPRNSNIDDKVSTPPRRSQMEYAAPKPQIVEEELNFDDILGNADKKAVFRSGIRARLGINERNPSTKEEEEMFSQWEVQTQSQLLLKQVQPTEIKQNQETTTSSSPNRVTKMKAGTFHSNPLYSKLYTIDKITRIDRILNSIFNGKQRVVISSQLQPPNITQSIPILVKMEAPKIQVEVKKQEVVEVKKIQQVSIELPQEMQSKSEQAPNRNMFAMSKEMLIEMNMKIKRRNELINNEKPYNPVEECKNQRSVSPFTKRRRNLEKFEDA